MACRAVARQPLSRWILPQDQQLILREQTLKKKDVEFQDHLCRFIRFLQAMWLPMLCNCSTA